MRYRSIQDIMAATAPAEQGEDQGEDLLVVKTEELTSFQEAQAYKCWRKAMRDEMVAIEANGTWELVNASVNHRLIGLKCIFKMMKDDGGIIVKYKACLVDKGYVQ
jgi:hypothetical protein